MTRIYTLFYILFFVTSLSAQSAEQLTVHFDKPFYVSGENIWYKIYFGIPVDSMKSKVVRIELINSNGAKVIQQKIQIKDNYALGDMTLPYDWKEGNYLFRAYTLWSLNFGETTLFEKIIPIYNLLETTKTLSYLSKDDFIIIQNQKAKASSLEIVAQLNKPSYTKNEIVELQLSVKDKKRAVLPAHISIAVTDGNYLPNNNVQLSSFSEQGKIIGVPSFQAEQNLQLYATLQDGKRQPVTTQFLSLYFPELGAFKSTKIEKGNLKTPLPNFYENQVIQVFDFNPFHDPLPTIQLQDLSPTITYRGVPTQRDNTVENYLYHLSLYRQYQETFKMPSLIYPSIPSINRNIWQPDEHFDIADYNSLPDVVAFADEALIKARMITKKGQLTLRLPYENNKILHKKPPWYLYNNWMTLESPAILKTPLRAIETIDIYNNSQTISQYLDPALVRTGVFAIYTKDGKTPKTIIDQPNNKTITGYYYPRTFTSPTLQEKVPYFPPLIYWNGQVETDATGKATVQFNTSSSIGRHIISVVVGTQRGTLEETNVTYLVVN